MEGIAEGKGLNLDAFIDLDGDGVPDHLETKAIARELYPYYEIKKKAWINTFKPPVIKYFSNGLAKDTVVDYRVISTESAEGIYTESGLVEGYGIYATRIMMAPMRVVAKIIAANPFDAEYGTNEKITKYRYADLRTSVAGRGPQGFKQVITEEVESKIKTETTYEQRFPFTGRPRLVERYYDDNSKNIRVLLTKTTTRYQTDVPYYNPSPIPRPGINRRSARRYSSIHRVSRTSAICSHPTPIRPATRSRPSRPSPKPPILKAHR